MAVPPHLLTLVMSRVLLAEIKDMTAALETSLKSINDNVSCVLTHFQNKERGIGFSLKLNGE